VESGFFLEPVQKLSFSTVLKGRGFSRAVEAKYPTMILQFFNFQQGIRDSLVGDRMMAMLSGFFGVLAALRSE
jgi:hypothetical protein